MTTYLFFAEKELKWNIQHTRKYMTKINMELQRLASEAKPEYLLPENRDELGMAAKKQATMEQLVWEINVRTERWSSLLLEEVRRRKGQTTKHGSRKRIAGETPLPFRRARLPF